MCAVGLGRGPASVRRVKHRASQWHRVGLFACRVARCRGCMSRGEKGNSAARLTWATGCVGCVKLSGSLCQAQTPPVCNSGMHMATQCAGGQRECTGSGSAAWPPSGLVCAPKQTGPTTTQVAQVLGSVCQVRSGPGPGVQHSQLGSRPSGPASCAPFGWGDGEARGSTCQHACQLPLFVRCYDDRGDACGACAGLVVVPMRGSPGTRPGHRQGAWSKGAW